MSPKSQNHRRFTFMVLLTVTALVVLAMTGCSESDKSSASPTRPAQTNFTPPGEEPKLFMPGCQPGNIVVINAITGDRICADSGDTIVISPLDEESMVCHDPVDGRKVDCPPFEYES